MSRLKCTEAEYVIHKQSLMLWRNGKQWMPSLDRQIQPLLFCFFNADTFDGFLDCALKSNNINEEDNKL